MSTTKRGKHSMIKMADASEEHRIHKEDLFDLPMKILIIGKSQLSGKTNTVGNLVLRPYSKDDPAQQMYNGNFLGRNIYIVCPSIALDPKWPAIIESKQIPPGNISEKYDEEELIELYKRLERNFKINPEHTLVILDDCSFSGALKAKLHGAIAQLFMNGRHLLISTIVTAQKYSDIFTGARENCTGAILYKCSRKQAELIDADFGEGSKTNFMKVFRKITREKHSFMVVNFTNDPDKVFMDSNFEPIAELNEIE
jgi:hypothetical protein